MKPRYVVRITPADVGRRVTVRARTRAHPPATDTVGVLRAWAGGVLVVERRDGTSVRIPEADVLAARAVPGPPPERRRAPRKPTAPDTHPAELARLALQEQRHPEFDPLAAQAVAWLVRAHGAVVAAQAETLRPLGLSPSAFNVLMALQDAPERTLEPRDLSERLLVSRPSVTGLLDTLQAKGLITRCPHPRDGRRVLIAITPAGEVLLDRCLPSLYTQQRALLEGLTPEETATLVALLRRIRGATPPEDV